MHMINVKGNHFLNLGFSQSGIVRRNTRMLNTADPTIVPTPMSPSVMKVPMTFTKSSGADVAAAMKVAPATSEDIFNAKISKSAINILLIGSLVIGWHEKFITDDGKGDKKIQRYQNVHNDGTLLTLLFREEVPREISLYNHTPSELKVLKSQLCTMGFVARK
nr:unnamed protein product [Callosobruchus chinensis]